MHEVYPMQYGVEPSMLRKEDGLKVRIMKGDKVRTEEMLRKI